MKKIVTVITVLCILIMAISGCASSGNPQNVTIDEIIIEYKSASLDIKDVGKKMYYYLTPQNMTISDLSKGSDQAIWARFKNDIVFELAVFQIALEKSKELGLNKLSAAEQNSIDQAYEAAIADSKQAVLNSVNAAVKGNPALNFDTEEKRQLEEYFYLRGYDYATYKEELIEELIVDKVKNYFTKDTTVTEAEVRAKYDNDLAVQKANIKSSPASIEQQISFGTTVLYYPEGYMYAKHILVSFESATRGAAAIAYTNGDIAGYNKIIKEGYPEIEDTLNLILSELENGADFDALAEKYNEDNQMKEEPFKSKGFMIGPYSSFDIAEYTSVLTTLKKQGDYSEPVLSYLGGFIIYCEKMLAGAVPFEDIQNKYTQDLVNQKKAIQWSTLSQEWFDSAKSSGDLKVYSDKLEF